MIRKKYLMPYAGEIQKDKVEKARFLKSAPFVCLKMS